MRINRKNKLGYITSSDKLAPFLETKQVIGVRSNKVVKQDFTTGPTSAQSLNVGRLDSKEFSVGYNLMGGSGGSNSVVGGGGRPGKVQGVIDLLRGNEGLFANLGDQGPNGVNPSGYGKGGERGTDPATADGPGGGMTLFSVNEAHDLTPTSPVNPKILAIGAGGGAGASASVGGFPSGSEEGSRDQGFGQGATHVGGGLGGGRGDPSDGQTGGFLNGGNGGASIPGNSPDGGGGGGGGYYGGGGGSGHRPGLYGARSGGGGSNFQTTQANVSAYVSKYVLANNTTLGFDNTETGAFPSEAIANTSPGRDGYFTFLKF